MEDRVRYLQIVAEVHDEWERATEPVRFAPPEWPAGSDYNLHVLDIEATGEQLDDLDRRLRERLRAEGLEWFLDRFER